MVPLTIGCIYNAVVMIPSIRSRYYHFFGIHEIESSPILQLLFYVLSLSFFVTFYNWVERDLISISTFNAGTHVCPPYFLTCGDWYFLQSLPYGYSQSAFYVTLFLALGYGVYSAYRRDWAVAHAVILVCLTWKFIWAFFLTYGTTGNFDYYDMGLAVVWLFFREKEYFAKITFVSYYVLASSIKIDGGWIFGNYFNSLFTGAPIFAQPYLPIFTNLLIVMQMVGSWFLLSNKKFVQRSAFIYFLLFHTYSGIIVNYRYITISIPALFVLFSNPERFAVKRISKATVAGYAFLLLLLCGQLIGIVTPGDQKKTLEGNYYGLYMFEANHQCISRSTIFRDGAEPATTTLENHVANKRCDTYRYWHPLKTRCERDPTIERIAWTFDHSINGGPYERIVDTPNACTLTYTPLGHNEWIRIEKPAVVDRPVHKTGFVYPLDARIKIPVEIVENDVLLGQMKNLYWSLWVASIAFACATLAFVHMQKK